LTMQRSPLAVQKPCGFVFWFVLLLCVGRERR
jgi:hypothetical protein